MVAVKPLALAPAPVALVPLAALTLILPFRGTAGAPTTPLASVLPSGLTAAELQGLRGLREAVAGSDYAAQFIKRRTFGVDGSGQDTVRKTGPTSGFTAAFLCGPAGCFVALQ